jgi:arylsulfatase A-like enzyme/tetratricopeptide (TPR) repeat protein
MAGAFLSHALQPLLGSEHATLWEHRNDREFLARSLGEESPVALFAALQMLGLGVRDADTEALKSARQFLAAYCENVDTPTLDALLAAEAASAFINGVYKAKPGEAWTPHLRGMADELTALALACAERQASEDPATLETRAYLQHAAKRFGQEFRFLGEKRCLALLAQQFPEDVKAAEWLARLTAVESDVWRNHHEAARTQRELWTGHLPAEEQETGILREINYLYFSGDYPAALSLIQRAGLLSSKQEEREVSRVLQVLCLFRQGKLEEAGKIAADFIEHRDPTGPWYGHMLLLRAYLLMLEGKRVEAAAVAARVQPGQLDEMRQRKVQEMLADVVQGADNVVEAGGAGAAKTLPNIMLISLDTVRPDHLGCYGYETAHTPNIDALAAGGVVFERAYSTSSWTKPSHASVFTGLYPLAHGAQGHVDQVAPKAAMLPEMLGGLGYTTLGTISAPPLNSIFGFARGFDWYDDFTYDFDRQCNLFLRGNGGPVKIHSGSTGTLVTHAAMLAWERRDPATSFFQFVNYFDAHHNYQPPYPWSVDVCGHYHGNEWGIIDPWLVGTEPFDPIKEKVDVDRLKSLYDAEIAAVDAEVGAWVKRLKEEGKFDSTLWVLFGDHGEEFLEHGGLAHGRSLNEEVIRVPLIIAGPGVEAGKRVADAVSLVDVAPTILELLAKEAPAGLDGVSLLPAIRGETLPKRSIFAGLNLAEFQGYAIIEGTEKLILNAGTNENACYDLAADPTEATNLAAEDTAMSDRLAALAVRHQDMQRQLGLELGSGSVLPQEQVPALDELVEQLRAMGYLGN